MLDRGDREHALQHYDAAINILRHSEGTAHSNNYTHDFLALCDQHLGNCAAALEHLDTANETAEQELAASPVWNRRSTRRLLQTEVSALIRPKAADK